MDSTRQIYWNVSHAAVLPMYLLAIAAFALLGYGFLRSARVWLTGKKLNRFDHSVQRARQFFVSIMGQGKLRRASGRGLCHALFFWCFLILFAGTLIIMFQVDFLSPVLHVNIFSGYFYKGYSLLLDLAGFVAICMLVVLMVYKPNYKRKEDARNNFLMLVLLLLVLSTGFLVEGLRIAATEISSNARLALYSPVGLLVGQALFSLPNSYLLLLHKYSWWAHCALSLGAIAFIPYTGLRHVVLSAANIFLGTLEPKGSIDSITFEEESCDQIGAVKATDLTWKDILDADACVSCARCEDRCPASLSGKPLSPMELVKKIGQAAKTAPSSSVIESIGADAIWSCTTCYACQDICPTSVEHVNKILQMRRHMAMMEAQFPGSEVQLAVKNIENNYNPFGFPYAKRGDWAESLPVSKLAADTHVDILYFAGCYASFDKRNQMIAKSFLRVCNAAGIRVGILGKDERCCGEPVRKLGNEFLYQNIARENIQRIQKHNVKKIVTTCPHCFNTLARDYRELGLDASVEHYSTFVEGLLRDGRLQLAPTSGTLTYHDSCYLARYMDITEQPRAILCAIGFQVVEMEKNCNDTMCCGGGGGRILAEENIGSKISDMRVSMALESESPVLATSCPFCLTMLEAGVKSANVEERLEVKDILEILSSRIVNQ